MGLIVFDGGPLDGSAYETKDLLGLPSINLPLNGYVWTSEKRTSPRTGAIASVWKFQGDGLASPPQESPEKVVRADEPDFRPPAPDAAPPEPGPAPTPPAPDQAAYRARRDAVKATRAVVCAQTGLKPSRLFAIEAGTGKPITTEERDKLEAALAQLEGQAEASAH